MRTEKTLADTPIAVSAFTSTTMQDMQLNSAMDYEAIVPSLSIQTLPNRTSIRGVGRFSNSVGIAPGVAMYQDGAYNQENTALGVDAMNTESVQVLRGPQGTLFGRNTTGGATLITTKKPTDELYLEVRAGAGNYGTKNVKVLVSGPLGANVRGKIYYSQWEGDGEFENISGQDTRGATNGTNSNTQWILDWQVTDNLFVQYIGGSLKTSEYSGGTSHLTGYDPFNVCTSILAGWCSQFSQIHSDPPIETQFDPYKIDINDVGETRLDDHLQTNVQISYDFGAVDSKFTYYNNRYDWSQEGMDFDGTSSLQSGQLNNIEQNQRITTMELLLTSQYESKLQWVAGVYYLSDENEQPYQLVDNGTTPGQGVIVDPDTQWCFILSPTPWTCPPSVVTGENPDLIYYHQNADLQNDNIAVFGEGTYSFNETWALTVGLRYSKDELEGTETQLTYGNSYGYLNPDWFLVAGNNWCAATFGCIAQSAWDYNPTNADGAVQTERSDEKSFSNTSGRLILQYTPNDSTLIWGTISNGFKVGGWRLGAMEGLETGESPFFDPEEVLMFELGWKGTPIDKWNFEVVGFYYDYQDMQQLRGYTNAAGIGLEAVENIDSEMYGIELTTQWLATANLSFFATYSYNHAKFNEDALFIEDVLENNCDFVDELNNCIHNINGNRLDITPEHKVALNAIYTIPTSVGLFGFGGTVSHASDRAMDIFNSPELTGDDYTRLDIQTWWTSPGEKWTVRAWVQNATDELWYNTRSVTDNSNPGISGGSWYPATDYNRFSGNPASPRRYNMEVQFNL